MNTIISGIHLTEKVKEEAKQVPVQVDTAQSQVVAELPKIETKTATETEVVKKETETPETENI